MFLPRRALVLAAGLAIAGAGCGGDSAGPEVPDPEPEGYPAPDPYVPDTHGLFALPEVPENPLTVQGVALGRRLFHDPILSGDFTQSCATCHAQPFAFSDHGLSLSVGIDGSVGTRNAPAIINVAWSPDFFWAGRAATLEDQAREPVPNPIEMNVPWAEALARVRAHPEYPELFGRAFQSEEITQDRVVKAIAQFERTLLSQDSKWDRVARGEDTFTVEELRGQQLFFTERADCFHCHGTRLFTDFRYHDNGIDLEPVDPGRMTVTGSEFDFGKFRSPTLRNIEVTAPYMHDGRFATLEEVIEHYSSGIQHSPNLDPLLLIERPGDTQEFTEQEKGDLLAFLKTLTDPVFLSNPGYGPPGN
jgi:cytochrome c peroxidase